MSLLQLARCCNCAQPVVPCSDCSTNKCTCEDPQGSSSSVPVTAVHIEVGRAGSARFRSNSTKDSTAWHYMNNLRWRATEYGPKKSGGDDIGPSANVVNRLVLSATAWMLGFRYGDKLGRIGDKLMPLVLPAGRWGTYPTNGLNARRAKCGCLGNPLPCSEFVMCCYCDIPGNPHNGGVTTPKECTKNGGTIIGDAETSPDLCYPACENQGLGAGVSRLGRLIPDPLRKGKEFIANKFRLNRLGLHRNYLLRQNAAETATNPVVRSDSDYDLIAKAEQEHFDKIEMLPITSEPDGLTPRYSRIQENFGDPGECGECVGNQCSQSGPFWSEYFDAFDQRSKGVWNFVHPTADCCNASYAGTSYTIEMDWPCEETSNAYIKAKQKYDFGRAAFEEAQRYCSEEGEGTLDCGGPGGPIDQAYLCHPLATELIGAQPPNLVPCIKHCPLQAGMGACQEGYRRWPQGDFQPLGENVQQNVPCLGGADVVNPNDGDELPEDVQPVDVIPTGEAGCSFNTNPVGRNYSSIANCDEHQCGAALCGAQFCCREEDCFEYDCCEQLLYNPQTGETALYNDDGCIVDEDGQKIGGWRTYPDADGSYFRCPRQEVRVTGVNDFGDEYTICPGCTETRSIQQSCADCGPQNAQQPSCRQNGSQCNPRGDVTNWTIPRKIKDAGQGSYSRHCPDHLEPFNLNGRNRWGSERCDRKLLPALGDEGFCWYDVNNPQGTFCAGGFCTQYNGQLGAIGRPFHTWPVEDIRHTNCQGPYSGPKGPCERQYILCPPGETGGEVPDPLDPAYPQRPPGGDGTGNNPDDCNFFCVQKNDDVNHCPGACGATPCDDRKLWTNTETGQTVDRRLSPGGPPDDSGNWKACGCYRCPFDGIGRKTKDDLGCVNPCEGVRGYNSALMAFYDGYTEEEMGLQLVSVSCGPQKHRAFEIDGLGRRDTCTGQTRSKYASEAHFSVYLEYKGGGCGYNGFGTLRNAVTRQGQGRVTLAKDEDAPSTCVFGTYKHPIGRTDGWFTAGGANPAPYWQKDVNPGNAYYYKNILAYDENGRPDCNREIWKRPHNLFGCKFRPPKVIIL